MKTCWRKNLCS